MDFSEEFSKSLGICTQVALLATRLCRCCMLAACAVPPEWFGQFAGIGGLTAVEFFIRSSKLPWSIQASGPGPAGGWAPLCGHCRRSAAGLSSVELKRYGVKGKSARLGYILGRLICRSNAYGRRLRLRLHSSCDPRASSPISSLVTPVGVSCWLFGIYPGVPVLHQLEMIYQLKGLIQALTQSLPGLIGVRRPGFGSGVRCSSPPSMSSIMMAPRSGRPPRSPQSSPIGCR